MVFEPTLTPGSFKFFESSRIYLNSISIRMKIERDGQSLRFSPLRIAKTDHVGFGSSAAERFAVGGGEAPPPGAYEVEAEVAKGREGIEGWGFGSKSGWLVVFFWSFHDLGAKDGKIAC